MTRTATAALTLIASFGLASVASAQLLNDWNLSVFGNLTSSSEVEGRVQVLGNLGGNASNYGTQLTPTSAYLGVDVLRVGGNITTSNINMAAGNIRLGGTRTGNLNFNGGGVLVTDNTTAALIQQSRTEAYNATSTLGALAATGTISFPSGQPGPVTINAITSGLNNIAVFNITTAQLSSNLIQQIGINITGGGSVIINVTGSSFTFGNGTNFVGNANTDSVRSRVLWNFPTATTINLQTQWSGSILAPYAALTNSTVITGAVAVASFTQNGEVHRVSGVPSGYSGYFPPVPAPATAAVLGLGGLLASRRRR